MKRFLTILLTLALLAACGAPAAPQSPPPEPESAPTQPEPLTLWEEEEKKLEEMRKAALERELPSGVVETRVEYLALFPPAAFCQDETAQELSRLLYNAKLGTVVEDINFSEKAAFQKTP